MAGQGAFLLWLALAAGGPVHGPAAAPGLPRGFDHWKHRAVFPVCQSCHAGVEDTTRSIWPRTGSCAACHDGTIQPRVSWEPRPETRPTNLRFTHAVHRTANQRRTATDSMLACTACHLPADGPWMAVRRAAVPQCFSCHGIDAEHTAAPDTACTTCHLTLAEATTLPESRVRFFPAPSSHRAAEFGTEHGRQAKWGADGAGIAPSCATCHARDFCASCHVNAPDLATIQALAPDPRALAIPAELHAPATHRDAGFTSRHGAAARRTGATCAACHTRESCLACHRVQPAGATTLSAGGPGRGIGARIERRPPASHGPDFVDRHGPTATASPRTCSACHARTECLDCHRPNPAATGGYHPAGFLTRHPSAAYSRQTECADCHNQAQFCTSCHQQAGLVSVGGLQPGFHDAKAAFIAGHGQAARQSLESCVSCHSERDCLVCHSAQSGRRFNPHGPGFDPARLKRRNPQTCAACHGRAIPGP